MWVEGSTGCPAEAKHRTWSREEVARLLVDCDASRSMGQSQRAFAREHGIPAGTLRHWLARRSGLDADAQREYWAQKRNPGRPPAFDRHIAQAQAWEDAARQTCLSAVATCDEAEKTIRDVGRAYQASW